MAAYLAHIIGRAVELGQRVGQCELIEVLHQRVVRARKRDQTGGQRLQVDNVCADIVQAVSEKVEEAIHARL